MRHRHRGLSAYGLNGPLAVEPAGRWAPTPMPLRGVALFTLPYCLSLFSAVMKHVQTTAQSDLVVHVHRHQVSLPLINCFIYYTQLEASPRAHQPLLQLCHVLYWRLVDTFLHQFPNAVINRFNVHVVGWPHVSSNEFGFLITSSCAVWRTRWAGALSCWKM